MSNRLPAVNSPNFAESLSPPLELRQLALYFLSSKTHRSRYAINTSQSFFERVWNTYNYALIRSHKPVYCATGVVALTCFLFRAQMAHLPLLSGAFNSASKTKAQC